jgi:hypothetical protein
MTVFDLETAPIDDAAQYLESASAPANYKDPEKISAYIAEADRQALNKAALDVDLCRVVALGWRDELSGKTDVRIAANEDEERDMIAAFWKYMGTGTFIGYNVLDFDLPVLLRRSLYLGIEAPKIDLGKYRHDRVIDLMQMLAFDGKLKYRSLGFYCRRLNIPSDDKTTGADIGEMVARGDWGAVEAHCRADVDKTVALAERIGVLTAEGSF